jgi:[ribosomal protein S5]-alanine N-acetyltransferase
MQTINLPTIETERLILRPFQERDLDRYLAFMTDPAATQYLMLTELQKTEPGARQLFDTLLASYHTDDPLFVLAIELKGHGCIGSCGFANHPTPGVHEIYYSLLPAYWGRGFATEATLALIDFCLLDSSCHEIRAYMEPKNVRSAAVAERAGMLHWGIHRHPVYGNEARVYVIRREFA